MIIIAWSVYLRADLIISANLADFLFTIWAWFIWIRTIDRIVDKLTWNKEEIAEVQTKKEEDYLV
jgi:large-conductance mechanosensitive channel